MDAPELSRRLRDALAGLRAAGVSVTDAEIVWLADLARRADSPSLGSVAWVAGAPIQHCGVTFWPWTLLAETWFHVWYPSIADTEMRLALYAYAHVVSTPGDSSLRLLSGISEIKAHLRSWMDGLAMPVAQLVEVCERLRELDGCDDGTIPNPDREPQPDADTTGPNMARSMAYLCKAFPGSSPEYWATGIDRRTIDDMTAAIATAEHQQGQAPDPDDPGIRAIHNFRMAAKWVLKNHGVYDGK
jgi:hypothetical protein